MNQKSVRIINYYCSLCQKEEVYNLPLARITRHPKFPLQQIFIHRHHTNGKKVFTVLFLDENLQATRTISKYLTEVKKNKVMDEILKLNQEFINLQEKYQKQIYQMKHSIRNLQPKGENNHD